MIIHQGHHNWQGANALANIANDFLNSTSRELISQHGKTARDVVSGPG
jgi:hypothetical protein